MRPPSTQQFAHGGRAQTGRSGLNGYTLLIAIVGAAAGLLFGFDIAVINGAMVFVRQQFALSNIQTEIAASSLLAGCVIGASLAGFLSDSFGRRKVLLGAAALFALSSFGTALPNRLREFVLVRMLAGLATGTASLLAPLYIAEVSPARVRGRLVALDQLSIAVGVLGAYIIDFVAKFKIRVLLPQSCRSYQTIHSKGVSTPAKSSSWRCAGICGTRSRTSMWPNCSPNEGCPWIAAVSDVGCKPTLRRSTSAVVRI
jgi:MFS family permease